MILIMPSDCLITSKVSDVRLCVCVCVCVCGATLFTLLHVTGNTTRTPLLLEHFVTYSFVLNSPLKVA